MRAFAPKLNCVRHTYVSGDVRTDSLVPEIQEISLFSQGGKNLGFKGHRGALKLCSENHSNKIIKFALVAP